MSQLKLIIDLFQHMAWADAKIWESVLPLPGADQNKRLGDLLYHLHITQYAFYHMWRDLTREFPKKSEFGSLVDMARWVSEYHKLTQSFLSRLKEGDMDQELKVPRVERLEKILKKKPATVSLAESMVHVPAHCTYHRGQINAIIRASGGEPPLVDFITWVWLGKPDPIWPGELKKNY